MIIIDLFDIDFHIFTVIKFLFNLGVRFNYIYIITTAMNTRLWERKSNGRNERMNITYIYLNFTTKLNKNFIAVKMWKSMTNRSMIIIYIKYHLQLRK